MEKPYSGRATLYESPGELEIVVPSRKDWPAILFTGIWLGFWPVGIFFIVSQLFGIIVNFTNEGNQFIIPLFFLLVLTIWVVNGFFAIKAFFWGLLGKEIITIGQGQLAIFNKGLLFAKTQVYDLGEAKRFRAEETKDSEENSWRKRHKPFSAIVVNGTIRFDYGKKTIKFAEALHEAEANYILGKLKAMRILNEGHF